MLFEVNFIVSYLLKNLNYEVMDNKLLANLNRLTLNVIEEAENKQIDSRCLM